MWRGVWTHGRAVSHPYLVTSGHPHLPTLRCLLPEVHATLARVVLTEVHATLARIVLTSKADARAAFV